MSKRLTSTATRDYTYCNELWISSLECASPIIRDSIMVAIGSMDALDKRVRYVIIDTLVSELGHDV